VCVFVYPHAYMFIHASVHVVTPAMLCQPWSLQVSVLKALDHPQLLRFIGVLYCDNKEGKEGKILNILTGQHHFNRTHHVVLCREGVQCRGCPL
jgi:hypothetical protein